MKRNMIGIITLAVALLPLWLSGTAEAKSSYLTSFSSTYPSAPAAIKSCVLCHPGGNYGSLNAFANDYKAAGHVYATIESKDSDGDGATNLTEINAGTFPGDANSKPATAPPPPAAPTLSSVTISGPASLNEDASATFAATANWSDGSTSPITPTWSENSAYATINTSGVLTASAVTANQTVTVTASYTSGGITKTATKSVTITDVPAPVPVSGQTVFESNCAGCHTLTGTSVMNLAGDGGKVATSHMAGTLTADEATALAAFLNAQAPPPTTGDTDGDGMPDTFEQTYGFDPNSAGDATLDADGDGLVNRDEYVAGTHPKNPDTDNDGVWDGSDQMPKDPTRPIINDKGVYRYGIWYLDNNGNMSWDKQMDTFCGTFGTAQMQPVVGDWNGDGKSDVGAYENGTWYLDVNGNGQWDGGDMVTTFGTAQMQPVVGDWNGDGKSDIGAYENGSWYLDANGNGTWDGGDLLVNFGNAQMLPVVGDWNGDGKSDVGAFEKGVWYLDANGNGTWDGVAAGDRSANFGTASMLPIAGDWDGNGRSEIGTFEAGKWYLDKDGNGQWNPATDLSGPGYGVASDLPITGDWNGNGIDQIGVWR